MSDEQNTKFDWRAHIRLIGKQGFIRAEMTRLGFWPPSPEAAEQAAEAEAALKVLYDELAQVSGELAAVDAELKDAEDVTKLLAEIRHRRIERVRAERARKKVERAAEKQRKHEQDRAWRDRTLPFLGRGVSAGLRYEGGDAEKLKANELPLLTSAEEIANAIGITPRDLAWLIYHRGNAVVDHYHRFEIPKRRGGTRVISSPKKRLRVAQNWLLQEVLSRVPVHPSATAFLPQKSIADNARRHVHKAVVLRIDLKDFFPSIRFHRVKNVFCGLGYNEGVATIFALLATEAPRVPLALDGQKYFVALGERCLPQGACTSPALTNTLCRRLDARLTGAAQKLGFTYSRYADDLVFSADSDDAKISVLLGLVRRIVAEERFVINEEKTRVMRGQHRQAVTGVVVNETPHIARSDLRRFRAFLHQYEKLGREAMTEKLGQDARAYASGYLSFVHMVSPEQAAKIRAAHPWLEQWHGSA